MLLRSPTKPAFVENLASSLSNVVCCALPQRIDASRKGPRTRAFLRVYRRQRNSSRFHRLKPVHLGLILEQAPYAHWASPAEVEAFGRW